MNGNFVKYRHRSEAPVKQAVMNLWLSARHHALLQEISIMQARSQTSIVRDAVLQYVYFARNNKPVQFTPYVPQRNKTNENL